MESENVVEAVEHPVLEVEGVPYQAKITSGTLLRLQRENLDMAALTKTVTVELKDGKTEERKVWKLDVCFAVLAAMISHGKRKFTGEELADLLPADKKDYAMGVMSAAFPKVSPQPKPTEEPKPELVQQ